MKKVLMIVVLLGFHFSVLSQNKEIKENSAKTMKPEELPGIVIRNIGNDFSFYLTDKHPDPSVAKVQQEFISYNLTREYKDYDDYLVTFEGEKGKLIATYNSKGILTNIDENYTNVQLPVSVMSYVYKSYPGWIVVSDKYKYSQANGDITKKEYNLKLKKNNEVMKLKVNPTGDNIIADVE